MVMEKIVAYIPGRWTGWVIMADVGGMPFG
jgi:hypothetical protein